MSPATLDPPLHLDVLIVGAGISGIGVAHYLQAETRDKTFLILEARDTIGGTWSLFTYPGIRSDSDLYTFGYEFNPWREESSIAPAKMILDYLERTVEDEALHARIRLQHHVTSVAWESADGRWRVEGEDLASGKHFELTSDWVFNAGGYYRYDQGYTPDFAGAEKFRGEIVHPQHWDRDLDYANRRVVIIGSGATAVTLAPTMANSAASVTMVQRTPTYILEQPARDRVAHMLRRLLGFRLAHRIARAKNVYMQQLFWKVSRRHPDLVRKLIRRANVKALPAGYPVDVHFNPPYDPWDQRLCVAPDGDFFRAIRDGSLTIVTDHVVGFTENGVKLKSGAHIDADIIVTATGLNIQPLGGASITVDGETIDLTQHVSYRGMMLDGIPNFAYAIGYTNSSWTLKIGLLAQYFTRLLRYMDEHGWNACCPTLPPGGLTTRPLLDFGAGYVQRSIASLPRQGSASPWLTSMDYYGDVKLLKRAPVQDGNLRFEVLGARRKATAA
jgi:monooxygenase